MVNTQNESFPKRNSFHVFLNMLPFDITCKGTVLVCREIKVLHDLGGKSSNCKSCFYVYLIILHKSKYRLLLYHISTLLTVRAANALKTLPSNDSAVGEANEMTE